MQDPASSLLCLRPRRPFGNNVSHANNELGRAGSRTLQVARVVVDGEITKVKAVVHPLSAAGKVQRAPRGGGRVT